ncbi:hypothetical protein HDU81_000106 [Chytriomyces hyalinus]|nr:hypothetical protein HDU81_000106 [Chytriomyces hyalinus]
MRKHSTESTSNTQLQHEGSPSIVVFSGGSAANEIVSMIKSISYDVVYVMPVSDDGGSTSEIVKVVGGPGIGDIRSRLVRLSDTRTPEAKAVYDLLSYRLPTGPPLSEYHTSPAKLEWHTILEGNHPLWNGISLPYRETIRAFLLQFHYKILKEIGGGGLLNSASGEDNRSFDFRGGSLGNFFITGCRLFFDSLEAAIFQFARITRCPSETQVVPIVATNHNPVSIGVTLRNGGVIYGQCEISHPGTRTNPPLEVKYLRRHGSHVRIRSNSMQRNVSGIKLSSLASPQQSSLSKSLDVLKDATSANLFFSKTHEIPPLPSPIRRVFYINSERAETFPKINALLPEHLETKKSIIYSMGSLYTSLLPCLVVAGVGSLIARDFVEKRRKLKAEVRKLREGFQTLGAKNIANNPTSPPLASVQATSHNFTMNTSMSPPHASSLHPPTGPPKTFTSSSTSPFIFPTPTPDSFSVTALSLDGNVGLEMTARPTNSNRGIRSTTLPPPAQKGRTNSTSIESMLGSGATKTPHSTPTVPPRHRAFSTPPDSIEGFGATTDPDDLDKVKILLLNGTHDRETDGYTAMDFVLAITDVLNYSVIAEYGGGEACRKVMMMRDAKTDMDGAEAVWRWSGVPSEEELEVEAHLLADRIRREVSIESVHALADEDEDYDDDDDLMAQDISEMESLKGRGYLVKPYPPRAYITHLLYTEDSQVLVEIDRIGALGIKCIMVPKIGTMASCDRESASLQNMSPSKHIKGHFGSEELRSVLEPLLL